MKMAALAKKNGVEVMPAQSNRKARSIARSALHNRATDLLRKVLALGQQPPLVLIFLCWLCEVQQ